MIKLVCPNCKSIWYTSNTLRDQKCPNCSCVLIEKAIDNNKCESEAKKE